MNNYQSYINDVFGSCMLDNGDKIYCLDKAKKIFQTKEFLIGSNQFGNVDSFAKSQYYDFLIENRDSETEKSSISEICTDSYDINTAYSYIREILNQLKISVVKEYEINFSSDSKYELFVYVQPSSEEYISDLEDLFDSLPIDIKNKILVFINDRF